MSKKAKYAMTGFILGLISIIGWLLPLIGYPLTILSIIFGGLGLSSEKKGMATAGLVLGIVFLLATLANSILGAIWFMSALN